MELKYWRNNMLGDEITRILIDRIMSGSLSVGCKLDSERALAEEYGVSRTVIREALRSMSNQGFLDIKPGKGAYVRHPGSETITDSLVKMRDLAEFSLVELMEVRRMVELTSIRYAVDRASDRQLDQLEQHWQSIEDHAKDITSFLELDNTFHHQLFSLSGNSVLEMLACSLYDSIDKSWFIPWVMNPERMALSQREHREILDALRSRDGDRAEAAMLAHMEHLLEYADKLEK